MDATIAKQRRALRDVLNNIRRQVVLPPDEYQISRAYAEDTNKSPRWSSSPSVLVYGVKWKLADDGSEAMLEIHPDEGVLVLDLLIAVGIEEDGSAGHFQTQVLRFDDDLKGGSARILSMLEEYLELKAGASEA